MRTDELIDLGWRVRGELIDEDNKKYLFVVEDDEGNWMVLHFYTDPNNVPMVFISTNIYISHINNSRYFNYCLFISNNFY